MLVKTFQKNSFKITILERTGLAAFDRNRERLSRRMCQNIALKLQSLTLLKLRNTSRTYRFQLKKYLHPILWTTMKPTSVTIQVGKNAYSKEELNILKEPWLAARALPASCFQAPPLESYYLHMWFTKLTIFGTDGLKVVRQAWYTTGVNPGGLMHSVLKTGSEALLFPFYVKGMVPKS